MDRGRVLCCSKSPSASGGGANPRPHYRRPFLDKTRPLDYLKLFLLAGLRRSPQRDFRTKSHGRGMSRWTASRRNGGKQSLA